MLFDDLTTIRHVLEKKKRVRQLLKQNSGQCRSGLWYIEGAYARHHDAVLSQSLRYAIHDVWVRKRARQLVERISPPWCAYIGQQSSSCTRGGCSIGYLSHGGSWKLFDTVEKKVWVQVGQLSQLDSRQRIRDIFSREFDIPAWRIVKSNDTAWWVDDYIDAENLACSATRDRISITRTLIHQYAAHACRTATAPSSQLTSEAIDAIRERAPSSRFAQIVRRHEDELRSLGSMLTLIPVHGDLGAQNILVSGGKPWIIDWDNAGQCMPALYDLSYLIISEALRHRCDLLDALIKGSFDHDLHLLLSTSGYHRHAPDRLLEVIHGALIHFHKAGIAGRLNISEINASHVWDRVSKFY